MHRKHSTSSLLALIAGSVLAGIGAGNAEEAVNKPRRLTKPNFRTRFQIDSGGRNRRGCYGTVYFDEKVRPYVWNADKARAKSPLNVRK